MASTHKSLRSGTANKRPTTSIADGQIALNTNTTSPGLFFKDSTGATIIKVGPVHVGTTAPNASPAAGGSAGNSVGEIWLDTSLTPVGVKIWNGSAFVNATPIGSTTVQGLLELATNAETQTGTDPDRAVTPAGLQSKVSDSTSTTSSTTIASSTAVKSAYDLANAALPKSGGTVTGNLEIGTTGSLSFEGATADAFETTIAVVDPTADRTITLPDTTGTVVTTGDTGTVTSTMIADGTIVDGDISASAEIAVSKLADGAARQLLQTDAAGTGVEWASNIDVPGTLDVTSTATFDSIASHPLGSAAAPTLTFTGDTNTGIYSPGADQVAISTNGTGRLFVDSSGRLGVGESTPSSYDAGGNKLVIADTTNSGITIRGGTSGQGAIYFADGTTGNEAFRGRIEYSHSSDSLNFGTAGTGSKVTLDSSGRLGVGTTSPANGRLNVSSTTNQITLDTTDTATYGRLDIGHFTNGTFIGTYAGSNTASDLIRFGTGGTERLRITSAGLVGIGTSSPSYTLDVTGSARITSASPMWLGTTTGDAYIQYGSSATTANNWTVGSQADGSFRFFNGTYSSGTERLRITSSGNVGIGTTSPQNQLHLVGSSTANYIRLENSTGLRTYLGVESAASVIYAQNNAGGDSPLAFATGSTERARIDSSGRLLVGTSSSVDSSSQIQNYATSGQLRTLNRVDSLANSQVSSFLALGYASAGQPRYGEVGIYKHSGITNACAYLQLSSEDSDFNYIWADNSNVLRISSTDTHIGTTSGTVIGTQTSDERLKNILGPVEYGLDVLKQIEPVRYSLKSQPETEQLGFIAQQVEPLVPQAVFDTNEHIEGEPEDAPTKLGMEYVALIPVLVNSIKELSAEVDALKAQLQAQ